MKGDCFTQRTKALRKILNWEGEGSVRAVIKFPSPTLIADWRKRWNEGDFPFLIVQLANLADDNPDNGWPQLREAQFLALSTVPATGLAVTIDIGEALNIHPHNKKDVGLRLALWALANTYGRKTWFIPDRFTIALLLRALPFA